MAQYDLYVDVLNNQLVTSLANAAAAPIPPLIQGDTPTWRIFLVVPTGNFLAPYTSLSIGGLSLEVALGDKIGNATNYYATQFAWTPSSDPTNPNYFIGQFALNTDPITTALGGNASFQPWLEIKYVSAGVPTSVFQKQVTVNAAVIKGGGVVVPPGLNPISAEYANATFLTRTIHGGFFLVDDNTGKKVFIYLADDGTVHMDPVN